MFDSSVVGLIAGTCTTIAFIPQVLHTFRSRNTSSISLGMYILFVFGIAMWLCYGFIISDLPLVITNLITLLLSSSILLMKIRNTIRGEK
jgi:MtN3 and saliva related transmembrane protein